MSAAQQKSLLFRVSLNAASYGYAQFVTLAVQLLLVPFFLNYWGVVLYAEWLVLTGVPTMLVLLDFGVAQASASKATMSAGGDDWISARRSLQTAFAFSLLVGGIIIIVTMLANRWVDWSGLLNLRAIGQAEAKNIILFMAAGVAIQLLGGPLDAWFRAIDRTALGAFLLANRRAVDVVISTAVLVLGGTPLQLAAALFIPQVMLLAVITLVACRSSPIPMLGISLASWGEWRSIIKPAIAHAGFPLSQVITLQGSLQMLNQLADAKVVVAYTMARTLMRLILQIGVISNNALRPELSRLIGAGQSEQASKFTLKISRWALLTCITAYLLLVLTGPDIVWWWGNGKLLITRFDLAMVGAHALIHVAWFVPAAHFIAGNRHKKIAAIYAISCVVALALWAAFPNIVMPFIGASLLLMAPEIITLLFVLVVFSGRARIVTK